MEKSIWFVNFYLNDFHNPFTISNELEVWVIFRQKMEKENPEAIPNSIEATLKTFPCADGIFGNINGHEIWKV